MISVSSVVKQLYLLCVLQVVQLRMMLTALPARVWPSGQQQQQQQLGAGFFLRTLSADMWLFLLMLQVPKPLDPRELDQLKQQIASELHAQLAASSGGKELTPEQLAQVRLTRASQYVCTGVA
jgi:hypothetical protein